MPEAPGRVVARDFMRDKHLEDLDPIDVLHPAKHEWHFFYELPEGQFELLVCWTSETGWIARTLDFIRRDELDSDTE